MDENNSQELDLDQILKEYSSVPPKAPDAPAAAEPADAPQPKKAAKKKTTKLFYFALLGAFAIVFVVCAVKIGDYIVGHFQHQEAYEPLQSLHTRPSAYVPTPSPSTTPSAPSGSIPAPTEPGPTQPPVMLEDMAILYERNPHTVGWIYIDDYINWPVLQTPNTVEWINYYLYRDFQGNDDIRGSIYIREACDVFEPSDNVVIYGHNMKDMSMFGTLSRYRKQTFYENHKYIYFDTLYERHVYEVFAVFTTSGTLGEGYAYHLFNDARSEAEFNDFVATCKSMAFFDTGITPTYGDKLITLSTCWDLDNNGRLVVVARRVT